MPTTFIQPDYIIGNSATVQSQMIGVLQNLDQALQSLQPSPASNTVQFNDTIILDAASGATNTITSYNLILLSGTSQIDLDNTNFRLAITNFNNGANVVLGNEPALSSSNLLLTNNKDLFFESNTKQVIKYGGAGYGYTPRLLPDNDYIQRYMNCIVYDNGVSVLNLFPRDHYYDTQDSLSDDQRVGWSCKIINYNGVDVQLNSADGTNFFSHFGGISGNPYTIKKWSSIEIILIYSVVDNTYLWAVSQFN